MYGFTELGRADAAVMTIHLWLRYAQRTRPYTQAAVWYGACSSEALAFFAK